MRILEVVPHLGSEASGPTYAVIALSRSLASEDRRVRLFSVNGQVPLSLGLEHRVFGEDRWPRSFGRSHRFAEAALQAALDSDVVHAHGFWSMPSVYAARAALRSGTPLVLSPHGCLSPEALRRSPWKKRAFWAAFYRSAFASCCCFHATSEREYQDIRGFGLKNPIAVLPIGVDLPPVPSNAHPATRAKSILFLGRVHPIKGLDVLIPAWRKAMSAGLEGWTLRIVGPGDAKYVAQLRGMAGLLGLMNSIHFGAAVFGDAKWHEYASAAVTVLPSRTENFGMTVAESLAAGTPVIATKGTPWSGLDSERCGWWVDLSEASIACALVHAARTPEAELERMGSRGRAWMERSFSWPVLASEMARVYAWAAGRGTQPPSVRTT